MKGLKSIVATAAVATAASSLESAERPPSFASKVDALAEMEVGQRSGTLSEEDHLKIRATKSQRMRERRERVRRALADGDTNNGKSFFRPSSKLPLERLSKEDLESAYQKARDDGIDKEQHSWIRHARRDLDKADERRDEGRHLWGNRDYDPYSITGLASNVDYYGESTPRGYLDIGSSSPKCRSFLN